MDGCMPPLSRHARTSCASSASGKQAEGRKDFMSNTSNGPERPDEDNPRWTAEDIARARPASEVLRAHIGEKATQELLRRGKGRPPKDARKVNQTIRIDPDVLEAYRQAGKGWQTRINQALRENMPKQP